ncbi:MAG: DNA/RNA non-specific endonuclease, partial [Sphingomonadales bacterium]
MTWHRPILALSVIISSALIAAGPARAQEVACNGIFAVTGKPAYQGEASDRIGLCHLGYYTSFNPETKVPDWVQELVTTTHLEKNVKRKNNFRPDPGVLPVDLSPTLADYKGSGYDRGHQAPAGDMVWEKDAMSQSFYLSNMAPQVGRGFNRGVWRALETAVRGWVTETAPLIVITGPVYGHEQHTIGEGVVVPAQFYKVVYDAAGQRAIGFLLANKAADFNDYKNRIVA